ncbi:unnamed protein product [Choristocarpus tenellus]
MAQSIFNLVKNVMGAGMLSLPSGVAAFSDSRNAVVPAGAIVAILGALSAYTFSLIGRSCAESKAESYEQSWARSVGEKSSWLPAGACVATCFAGCLAYTLIIGDSFSALLQGAGAPAFISSRTNIILTLTALVLLPLSLLKNLKSLGFTSMLGSLGLLYTAVMMAVRFFDGSYAVGGKFHGMLPLENIPVFGTKPSSPLRFLVLVSMLSTAYEAHFNAPLFYKELKNNTLPRYNTVVGSSFLVAIVTMTAITAFGFLTFGGSTAGFILNNYSTSDRLAGIARLFVATSIVFSYPLCFVGLRDGIREMLAGGGSNPMVPSEKGRSAWTIGLLAFVSTVSLFLTDLGFVNSFGGALVASGIIYVFPALMFIQPLRRRIASGALRLAGRAGLRGEFLANHAIVVTGVVMGALGAAVSVLETFTNVLS